MIDLYEVIRKLNGPIEPVGISHIDSSNLENMEKVIELVEQLFFDLNNVSKYKNRPEYSMNKAGKVADSFLIRFKSMIGVDHDIK